MVSDIPAGDGKIYNLFLQCMYGADQRHILRDRRPSTNACPGFWAMGIHKVKKCLVGKNIRTTVEQPRQDTNLLYRYNEPNEPDPMEGPLSIVLVLNLPQFQQSAGAIPLWDSLVQTEKNILYLTGQRKQEEAC